MALTIGTLLFRITADTAALRKGMTDTQRSISTLKKSFMGIAAAAGLAFSASAVINFTKEITKLAGEAEGVKAAFNQLPDSVNLINDLTRATMGTVSQVKLMQLAIQAKNFKLPLSELATYFEFATKRAAQTGESVDYLTNSIILGLGRGSIKILDNLGLSALELQKRAKTMGSISAAAASLIKEEFKSMGDVAKTTAQETQTLAANWINIKTEMGAAFLELSNLNEGMTKLNKAIAKNKTDGKTLADTIRDIRTAFVLLNAPLNTSVFLLGLYKKLVGEKITNPLGPGFGDVGKGADIGLGKQGLKTPKVPGRPAAPSRISGIGTTPAVRKTFPGSGAETMTMIGGQVQLVNQKVSESLKAVVQPIREAKQEFLELGLVVQQAFMGAVDSFGGFIEQLAAGNLENAFSQILKVFAGFIIQMGKMVVAYGISMLAIKKAFTTPGPLSPQDSHL